MPWTTTRPATARTDVASRAAVCALVLAACGLVLAGCSSGSGAVNAAAGASASASASASPDAKAMDAYRQCLAQHGVTMAPRPSGSGRPSNGTRGPVPGAVPAAGVVARPQAPAAALRPTRSAGRPRRRARTCARSSTGAAAPAATAVP